MQLVNDGLRGEQIHALQVSWVLHIAQQLINAQVHKAGIIQKAKTVSRNGWIRTCAGLFTLDHNLLESLARTS